MRLRHVGFAVVFALSCTAATAPIREQDAEHQAAKPGWLLTTFGTIYVPPGTLATYTVEPLSLSAQALLAHERVHAARQVEHGGTLWNLSYNLSATFRWDEERRAYEAQIATLLAGKPKPTAPAWFTGWVNVVTDASYRDMVSREDAEVWLRAFVAGLP